MNANQNEIYTLTAGLKNGDFLPGGQREYAEHRLRALQAPAAPTGRVRPRIQLKRTY